MLARRSSRRVTSCRTPQLRSENKQHIMNSVVLGFRAVPEQIDAIFAYTVGVVLVTIFVSVSVATAQAPDKSVPPDQSTLQGASPSAMASVAASDATATPEPSASEAAGGKKSSAQTAWKPSTELCSVDHEYCVKIVAKTQDSDHRTLTVSSKARVLAQFPTFGYLMAAFWSPDNKYVAINNRRANAGDYLWVISLSDGAALKIPDDLASETGKKNLGHINGDDPWGKTVREVTTRFTECAHDRLDHQFLFAQGWKGASELVVLEELQFSNEPPQRATITAPAPGPDGKIVTRSVTATVGYYGPGAPGIWITVNKVCRVTGNKITLKGQTIEKNEHSSEFVNRAWTYGSYWMKNPAEDFFISAQAKQAKGDLDRAISDYSSAIELDPTYTDAYNNRGNAKNERGDPDGAISDFNQALKLNPKYAYAYNNRALAKQAKGDLDGAIADFSDAIEVDPKYANAYANRGVAKQAKGDLDGAIADFNRAVELDPKLSKPYSNRGFAKQAKDDLDGAIADFNHVIEVDPKNALAYFDRGNAKGAKGDLDGAIADYNRTLELDPKNVYAYNNRGLTKQSKGHVDGAIADYNRTLELDPKKAYPYNNRALAKDGKGDYDGAIADCNRAIELDPKYAKSYRNRGFAKEGKGDVDGAIADYNRAIELDPKYADAYSDRGLAKALLRDWAGALADYGHFCELSASGQDYTRLSIWLIRTRLGETEAASRELSTYLDKRQKTPSSDWFSKVAEHLLGKVSEADLFAAAASPNPKTDSGQHCEAWFYAGMKKLFSGDKKTAANYFHKCLATEQKDFTEFQLAQSELQALGK
jgi:tetratricopeptide (TPR) repeat protein